MLKKTFSLGMTAAAAILLGVTSCGNKVDASQESAPVAQAVEEIQAPAPSDTVIADVALAAVLDQLTPENDAPRDSMIHITPSGLKYRIITEGTGRRPTASDVVEVNYEGKTLEGKTFDSSYQRGESISFPLSRVIPGWTEGVQLMQEGAVYEFYIPSNLAYGERGVEPDIAPNSDLLFKVQLIKVQ